MGKSRSRVAYPEIIDRPELKTPLRVFVECSITVTLWALWMHWILPIITVLLWAFGLRLFYHHLITEEGILELLRVFKTGGVAVFSILTLEMIWVYYNYIFIFKRFGERRKKRRECSDEDVAGYFALDPQMLKKAKNHSRIHIEIREWKISIKDPH